MDVFMALIAIFGGNFNPRGWYFCQGQIMSIAQNTALFSLLGTTYGGNGQTTFALPDLRGRAPIGVGQGPGLQPYAWGQLGGSETHTLIITEMPAHNHTALVNSLTVNPAASTAAGTTNIPDATMVPAKLPNIGSGPTAQPIKGYAVADNTTTLAPAKVTGSVTVGIAGGSQPFSIQNPYLAVNYIIAYEGIYPSRN
ncbi:phage tail protein [Chitinophaga pinensis]|uniref:Tail Collar domain protein n=1 Tax=Chitinophaga pinensis (strain ATCC 43595 / DSM 2588 / LMG 13176 / NBRC 15968 / NCIMB 11800 / UQM 2034) TaxID=485918 RepID=A0A979G9M9_CHIPD|nr:tail fiber protein [Chitinophaga pinensis]ACU63283.1 Tail Collar domain protein [Chitinophaga pinensis DSM 2588]